MTRIFTLFYAYKHLSKEEKRLAIKSRIILILRGKNDLFRRYLYKKNCKNSFFLIQTKELYLCSTLDKGISKDLFMHGEYGLKNFYSTLKILGIEKIRTLIDVGANIGVISIPVLVRDLAQNAICIEPNLFNYNLLKVNIFLNELEDRVKLVRAAASDHNGTLNLQINLDSYGDHEINYDSFDLKQLKTDTVPAVSLDDIVGSLDKKTDLIWMDIQGYEMIALNGLSNNLKKSIPLVFEFWPKGLENYGGIKNIEKLLSHYSFFIDLQDPTFKTRSISDLVELYAVYFEKRNTRGGFTDILVM
jgi:FkbM family methyltransferase